jgi:hypothetical protein
MDMRGQCRANYILFPVDVFPVDELSQSDWTLDPGIPYPGIQDLTRARPLPKARSTTDFQTPLCPQNEGDQALRLK